MKRSFRNGILLVILLVVSFNVFAQVSPYSLSPDWYFGQNGRLTFPSGDYPTSGAPTPGFIPTTDFGVEASTSVCHQDGSVAVYTNTLHAFNGDPTNADWPDNISNYNLFGGGDNTCAGSATGGAVAFPDPENPNSYYVVLANDMTGGNCANVGMHMYRYTGTGTTVTQAGGFTQLSTAAFPAEAITVSNDRYGGYWLIIHDNSASNTFRVWHFSTSGITGPVDYTFTPNVAATQNTNSYLKLNACQDKIAYHSGATIVIHSFNNITGVVGAEIDRFTTSPVEQGIGLEFSPDGNRIFHNGLANQVKYFDIGSGTDNIVGGATPAWSMQLGPDGNIYVALDNSNDVGVISNANTTPAFSTIALPGSASTFRGMVNQSWMSPENPEIDTNISCLTVDYSYEFLNYFLSDIDVNDIRWDFGEGSGFETGQGATPSHTYATGGTYQVIVELTDTYCGQLFYDTIDVTVADCGCTKSDAEVTAPTASYCEDDSLRLSAIPQDPSLTYQWVLSGSGNISGATDTFYYATSPGDYAVTITNACGDSTSLFFTVTENPKPLAPTIVGTTPVCPGDSGGYKVPTGFASYTWGVPGATTLLNGQGSDTITVEYASTAGDITLVVTNGFGCPSDEASLTVTMSSFPAAPVIVGKDIICPGQQDVGYEIQSPTGGSTYNWNITGGAIDFNGNDTISVDYGSIAPFTVEVSATNISGCSSPVAQLNVDPFAVTVNSSGGPGCLGQNTITLTASTNGTIDSIRWYYNGAMVPDILGGNVNPLQAGLSGNYNAIVYDLSVPCGDSAATTTNLTFNLPPTSNIGPLPGTDTMTINLGETVNLTGTPGGGVSPYNTVWLELTDGSTNTLDTKTGVTSPVDLNGLLPFDQSDNIVEYVFNVTDDNGCPATDTMRITIMQVDVLIPNIITPNGDNSNQAFEIVGILPGSKVAIFNRWGKQIYMSENYDNTWQADDESDGIYYVNIKMGITEEEYKGWVYVVR